MIGCQKRFTFASIEKDGINWFRRFQLDTGRETCTTHTNDSCFTNDINDFIRSKIVKITMWLYGFVQSIFSIRFNNNSHHFTASCAVHTRFNSNYCSAYAGMYRSADKSGSFANLLTDFYCITNLNDGIRRSTQMLRHGNYNRLRIRELLKSNVLTEFLAL